MLKAKGTTLVLGLRDIMDEPALLVREWKRKHALPALEHLYDEIWVYGLEALRRSARGRRLPARGAPEDGLHRLPAAQRAA